MSQRDLRSRGPISTDPPLVDDTVPTASVPSEPSSIGMDPPVPESLTPLVATPLSPEATRRVAEAIPVGWTLDQVLDTFRQMSVTPSDRDSPSVSMPTASPVPNERKGSTRRKLPDPEAFTGKPEEVRSFVARVRNVISGEKDTFADESMRIAYLASLLRGIAFQWYENYLLELQRLAQIARQDLVLVFDRICEELILNFADPLEEENALRQLRTISQGRDSVRDYALKFRTLAARTKHQEYYLAERFVEGLAIRIQQQLILAIPSPKTLNEKIHMAAQIEAMLKQFTARAPQSPYGNPPAAQAPRVYGTQPSGKRGPLTLAEKDKRRREGLCMYCGDSAHAIADCPKVPQPRQNSTHNVPDRPAITEHGEDLLLN